MVCPGARRYRAGPSLAFSLIDDRGQLSLVHLHGLGGVLACSSVSATTMATWSPT